MPFLWKAVAGVAAALFVAILIVAFWPKIEPSALSARAAVEQPVFVAAPAGPAQKPTTVSARPIAKAALDKLATALRGPTQDTAPIVSLAIPVGDARRMFADGLVAFAEGDIATARAFLKRAAEAGDPRALMTLGDTYDPATLARMGALGIKGDSVAARSYYSRAVSAGVVDGRDRTAALAAK